MDCLEENPMVLNQPFFKINKILFIKRRDVQQYLRYFNEVKRDKHTSKASGYSVSQLILNT